MISEARLAANRRNAQLSTGPRTPEGKRKVSQNARTHGYRAAVHVISEQQQLEIEGYAAVFSQSYPPQDAAQATLLRRMATAWWNILEFDKQTRHLYISTDWEYVASRLFTLEPYLTHFENIFCKALIALETAQTKPTVSPLSTAISPQMDESSRAAVVTARLPAFLTTMERPNASRHHRKRCASLRGTEDRNRHYCYSLRT